jgi:hypothetical protein
MVAVDIPHTMTYLESFSKGQRASIRQGKERDIHVKLQKMLNAFLLGVQFKGSSGFFEGAGTRMISRCPLE